MVLQSGSEDEDLAEGAVAGQDGGAVPAGCTGPVLRVLIQREAAVAVGGEAGGQPGALGLEPDGTGGGNEQARAVGGGAVEVEAGMAA